jgi:2-iminobutanoate/2-iminopropanoate deaminase
VTTLRQAIEIEKTEFFMPYAPVIRARSAGDLLFIAGCAALPLYHQHPHDPSVPVPEGITEQTRLAMENVQRCLVAGGAGWGDVVRMDYFVTDIAAQDAVGAALGEFLQGDLPTSTMVQVSSLVDDRLKIEINAIAVVSADSD